MATQALISSSSIASSTEAARQILGGRPFQSQIKKASFVVRATATPPVKQGANRPLWFASKQSLSYLDGSLPGDYGFDPLGLSDPEGTGGFIEPKWLAYGEVINGRFAMLGVVGAIAPEILGKAGLIPPETALPWFQTGVIPPAGTYNYWADGYTLFVLEMALMGFAEHRRFQDWAKPGSMGKQYFLGLEKGLGGSGDPAYPGGPFFNPLGFGKDEKSMKDLNGIPAKDTAGWWRVCFWISTIPAAILAVLMEFCAESPHWLVKRGRIDLAEEELEKLMGAPHVKYAIAEMSKTDKGDEVDNVRFGELLYGRHFKVVFIGSALFALQQLSGINAVFYFSSTVFKKAGVPTDTANTCVGIVNLTGSIIAMMLMDRLGRKVLLIGSFLGMAVATGLQVAAASSFVPSFAVLYLSVGGTLLYVLAFSLGAGPVPSLLLSEIFPGRIRAKAMALCMAAHWVINFLVGLLFLPMLEHLGPQIVYAIFAGFCLFALAFVKKNVVETKGKTLQEIEFALLPSH